ncbi:MAG TPA: hypothetical protein VG537_01030 [Candidatus Kapabacteria bacterium]|jgi:hypothetical protein|nr:hypothetical protein [Candidatus Kapabacteria bacterium]
MQSQLAASDVNRMVVKGGGTPSIVTFDSIIVTRVLVFVKDVKLHSDADDSVTDTHDGTIKTGPFVLVFDSTGSHVVTTATIPAGTYDRVKFEIHKPAKNDASDSAVLLQFPEFENGNQFYTVAIEGYTMTAGVRSYFTVHSTASKNVTFKFEDKTFVDKDSIVLGANTTSVLSFEFDPRIVFHLSGDIIGTLFDPRDTTHQNDIDNHVLIAIRIVPVS